MFFKKSREKKESHRAGLNLLFNSGSDEFEKAFDDLLNFRIIMAKEMKGFVLSNRKYLKRSLIMNELDERIAVYSLCFVSMLLKNHELKDKFHEYYEHKGSPDSHFISTVFKIIKSHYSVYYDEYNYFVETKDPFNIATTIAGAICCNNPNEILNIGMTVTIGIGELFADQFLRIIEMYGEAEEKHNIVLRKH